MMGSQPPMQHSTPRRVAIALAVPGALVSASACFLIPWMIETERRLQNDYWETQLIFAICAVAIASLGFPFLVLRAFCSKRIVAIASWVVVTVGYFAVFFYIVQSHFPIASKAVIGFTSGAFAFASMRALRADWIQKTLG